jgi:hypothetical protein
MFGSPPFAKGLLQLKQSITRSEMNNTSAYHPATELWHIWTVFIPRRSIAGRLVWGRVWRRFDGRRWVYKRLVEFDD